MSLQDKLNAYKAEFESKTPPEKLAIMHRATEDLFWHRSPPLQPR